MRGSCCLPFCLHTVDLFPQTAWRWHWFLGWTVRGCPADRRRRTQSGSAAPSTISCNGPINSTVLGDVQVWKPLEILFPSCARGSRWNRACVSRQSVALRPVRLSGSRLVLTPSLGSWARPGRCWLPAASSTPWSSTLGVRPNMFSGLWFTCVPWQKWWLLLLISPRMISDLNRLTWS